METFYIQHHHNIPQVSTDLGRSCLDDPPPLLLFQGHTSLGSFPNSLASIVTHPVVQEGPEISNPTLGLPCILHCLPLLLQNLIGLLLLLLLHPTHGKYRLRALHYHHHHRWRLEVALVFLCFIQSLLTLEGRRESTLQLWVRKAM